MEFQRLLRDFWWDHEIHQPDLLFLDEPTTGLASGTVARGLLVTAALAALTLTWVVSSFRRVAA